ncbi:hypothetical protein KVT40_004624 [Elsinoe batatas]|uniref:F-box domain-containing protein n=1 Tax=Elsinoe batatas TaxID=2601811 RepID=A0A8K0L3Q1_9PEZI|nr:hypothetical protein KVT40_004624 [Elsinoe batatas]
MTPYIDDREIYQVTQSGYPVKRARTNATAPGTKSCRHASDLPSEIIAIICSYLQSSDLCNIATCCKGWSETAISTLYRNIEIHESHKCYDGDNGTEHAKEGKDWAALVLLTTQLHAKPHLARRVRNLKVSRSLDRPHPPEYPPWLRESAQVEANAARFDHTIRTWSTLKDEYEAWRRALLGRDPSALYTRIGDAYLAVLLTCLPMLEHLDLMIGHMESARRTENATHMLEDMQSFTVSVLLRPSLPVQSSAPFPNLHRLSLSGELFDRHGTASAFELEADGILTNVGHLPQLKELTLYCGYLTVRALQNLHLSSSLQTLKLDIFSFLGSLADLTAILSAAPPLRTLVVTFKSEWQGPDELEQDIDAELIFAALLRHSPTLENLRLRLPLMDGEAPFTTTLPSLKEFTRLRRLHINSGFVFGDNMSWLDPSTRHERFRGEDPTDRLVDLLPASIEEVRLCRGDHETSITAQALKKVLERRATEFPALRLLIWVMEEDVVYILDRKDNETLMAAAREHGVDALILARDLDMDIWRALPSVELPVEDHFWASERTMALIDASGPGIKARWQEVATQGI